MAGKDQQEPKVPTERPDPEVADRKPEGGGEDRPGFDLGGASPENETGVGSSTIPGGPRGSVSNGTDAGGRATGLSDPSGSRSLGNEGDAGSESGSGPTDGSGGPS
ncbi:MULTISPECIES: hypothetical protein [Microvirga]|uniref:hypothetical protein n=1 Tax=Microvirga TaxID=186650 RepID=UPI001CFF95FE|nr:hypothetical protein [Microvirga lenta]MCB5174930.1 hypothetical protein [Microvirga lenta]